MNTNGRDEEVREIGGEVVSPSVVGQITKAELEQQIEIAKRYPRSIKQFRHDVLELATLDERTAEECIYAIPRDGKVIEGESARFAEILASAWGNCTCAGRVVDEGEKFVTAQGVFYDLQRNVRIGFEVRRRITGKTGRRFTDDMIAVTGNAAASIALRNAVLRGIPKALWASISDDVRRVIMGDSKTLATRRADAMGHLAKRGATEEMVLGRLGRASVDEITLDDLVILRGIATALREGDTTVEQAFARDPEPRGPIQTPRRKSEAAADDLGGEGQAPADEDGTAAPAENAAPEGKKKGKQKDPPDETKLVSKPQIETLRAAAAEQSVPVAELCEAMEIEQVEDLPANKVSDALDWLAGATAS